MISPKSAINIIKQYKRKKAIAYRIGPAETAAPPTDNATPKNIRKTIINGEKRIRRGVMITVSPTIRGGKVTAKPRAKGVKNATSQHISGINAGIIIIAAIIIKVVFGSPPLTIGNKFSAFKAKNSFIFVKMNSEVSIYYILKEFIII